MTKYSTKHIKEKTLEERARLASQYYIRARKAEDEATALRTQLNRTTVELARVLACIYRLNNEVGIEYD